PPVSPVPPVGLAPPAGYAASDRLADAFERTPPPGQQAVVLAALMIGLLLMGIQLWLLTVALELYLAGAGRQGWSLALVSGLIFLGGVLVTRRLGRRPRAPAPGPEVTDLRADW
ncbi:MAG: hypothetical protein H0V51_01735, partial [Chloroflexi bacterium]|nr:hypothetical protein [Chloroflexota bacterium]